jgi:hypothetical protein
MYPQRSQRECEVSQRIREPQLSQSMSSIRRILPLAARVVSYAALVGIEGAAQGSG